MKDLTVLTPGRLVAVCLQAPVVGLWGWRGPQP